MVSDWDLFSISRSAYSAARLFTSRLHAALFPFLGLLSLANISLLFFWYKSSHLEERAFGDFIVAFTCSKNLVNTGSSSFAWSDKIGVSSISSGFDSDFYQFNSSFIGYGFIF